MCDSLQEIGVFTPKEGDSYHLVTIVGSVYTSTILYLLKSYYKEEGQGVLRRDECGADLPVHLDRVCQPPGVLALPVHRVGYGQQGRSHNDRNRR